MRMEKPLPLPENATPDEKCALLEQRLEALEDLVASLIGELTEDQLSDVERWAAHHQASKAARAARLKNR